MNYKELLIITMIISGIFCYYLSEPVAWLMPKDRNDNIIMPYNTFPALLAIGGIALMHFGFLLGAYECQQALKSHDKL